MTGSEEYLLDNQQLEAGQRFAALSVLFNPSTFRHAQEIGLAAGWCVWEVGAGESDAYFPMGGPTCTDLERATVEQIRDALVAAGTATDAEIEQHLFNVGTGRLDLATSPMVSAWGRKPTA